MRYPPRTRPGPRTPNLGWSKMMDWLEVEGNAVSEIARVARVSQPTVHAWKWLDKSPTGVHLRRVCRLIGAEVADWEKVAPRRRKVA